MILDDIVRRKRKQVEILRREIPLARLEESMSRRKFTPRSFAEALRSGKGVRLIAEIKEASPSEGVICPTFNASDIALCYEKAGVNAISVLTETDYFLGRPSYLSTVRQVTTKPILRKDFLIDEYQLWESAVLGCDAALLIVSLLSDEELRKYVLLLKKLGIEPLVEVHTEEELTRALFSGASVIGINNRNLKAMKTDIQTTEDLMRDMPKHVTVVSESGIETYADIKRLAATGVHAFLVGTSILKSPDMGKKIAELKGGVR